MPTADLTVVNDDEPATETETETADGRPAAEDLVPDEPRDSPIEVDGRAPGVDGPKPEPSPDARTLAKIFELNRDVTRAEDDYLAKKEAAANAKKRLEAAQEWLNGFIRKNEFPLLDRAESDPGTAIADEPVVSDPAPAPEAWRDVPVMVLSEDHGLAFGTAEKLAEAGFGTVGKIADWTSAGRLLTEITGVGRAKADKIEEALESFWAAHAVESGEPTGGDDAAGDENESDGAPDAA